MSKANAKTNANDHNESADLFVSDLKSQGFKMVVADRKGNPDTQTATYEDVCIALGASGKTEDNKKDAIEKHNQQTGMMSLALFGIVQSIWSVDNMTDSRADILYGAMCSELEKDADISTKEKIGKAHNPKYRRSWSTRKSELKSAQGLAKSPLPLESRSKYIERARVEKLSKEDLIQYAITLLMQTHGDVLKLLNTLNIKLEPSQIKSVVGLIDTARIAESDLVLELQGQVDKIKKD